MLDDYGQLIVQRLPLYSQVLDSVDGQALLTLVTISQEEVFGCEITGYIEPFDLTSSMQNLSTKPFKSYILMY